MYKAQQGQQDGQTKPGAEATGDPSNDSDNVEDVDFEEVKE